MAPRDDNRDRRRGEEAEDLLDDALPEGVDIDAGLRAAFQATDLEPQAILERDPSEIAGFKILRRLGTGGMGVVYEAERRSPRRRVALKVARVDGRLAGRLHHESELLGLLHHPAIAEIHESGRDDVPGIGPVSYFAMALVEDARTITEFSRDRRLGVRERVALLIQAMEGVEHGHLRGVVHRDIKPSNLLVDASGKVRVIDFGLARALTDEAGLATMHTRSGEVLGTPQYMSPEQWTNARAVDARSDTYSLGVVLYQLVADRLPYDLSGKSLVEMAQVVTYDAPSRLVPFDRSAGVADLDVIVRKALEKDPERRYPTTTEFLADLRRLLAGEPVLARPPSTLYQLRRFASRNRMLVASVTVVLVVSVVAAVVSAYFAVTAARRGDVLERRLYAAAAFRAFDALEHGNITQVRGFLRQPPPNPRAWEWRRLTGMARDSSVGTLAAPSLTVERSVEPVPLPNLAVSPDRSALVTACADGALRFYRAHDGALERKVDAHRGRITAVAWSPDGDRVLSGDEGGTVQLRAAADGALLREWSATSGLDDDVLETGAARVARVAFGPGPDRVTVSLWRVFRTRVFHLPDLECVFDSGRAMSLDGLGIPRPGAADQVLVGDRLYAGVGEGEVAVVDRFLRAGRPISASFLHDGSGVVLGRRDKVIERWDTEEDEPRWSVIGHEGDVLAVECSPDGSVVASAGTDHVIKLWDVATGELRRIMIGHAGPVSALFFLTPDRLISSSFDGTLKTWDLGAQTADLRIVLGASRLNDVDFTLDGRRLLVAGCEGPSAIVDLQSREPRALPSEGWTRRVAVRPGASGEFAHSNDQHQVVIFDRDGNVLRRMATEKYASGLAYDPSGDRIAASDYSGSVRVWCADTGAEVWSSRVREGGVVATIDWSADGRWIAAGGRDGHVWLLRATDGEVRWRARHADHVSRLVFHPSRPVVVSVGFDGTMREWRIDDGEEACAVPSHAGPATVIAFTPDGSRRFVGHASGVVKLWSDDGDELSSLRCFEGAVRSIAVSPVDESVAIGGDSPVLLVWRVSPVDSSVGRSGVGERAPWQPVRNPPR